MRLLEYAEKFYDRLDPALPAMEQIELALRHNLERRSALWGACIALLPQSINAYPRFRAHQERLWRRVAGLVEQAKRDGDLKPDLATPVVLRLFSQLFSTNYDDLMTSGACSPEEIKETLLKVVLEGLRARKTRHKR